MSSLVQKSSTLICIYIKSIFFFYMGDNFERNLILTSSHIQTVIKNATLYTYLYLRNYLCLKKDNSKYVWMDKKFWYVSNKNLQQFFKDV